MWRIHLLTESMSILEKKNSRQKMISRKRLSYLKKTKRTSMVAIPTDETNYFRAIELKEYIKWVNDH